MQRSHFMNRLSTAALGFLVLLLGATLASAQTTTVNLSAGPTTLTLPDGATVPMWGYSCTDPAPSACSVLGKNVTGWSPVLITVPSGQDLQINLTNNLSFIAPDTSANSVPTSIVIVGQLGGGLGAVGSGCTAGATCADSPAHPAQPTTWPIADTGPTFTPPGQGKRVQSFSTEVAAGATTTLTWKAPRPGTYLLESGTHPSIQGPMGLYGIVVVTSAPSGGNPGTAYTNVSYNSEIPMLFSEIDPIQNNAVSKAVNSAGFVESSTNAMVLKPGPVTSLNLISGGSGYTTPPTIVFSPSLGGISATATIDTDPSSPTFQQVTGITLNSGGSGYTSNPGISFTPTAGGSGAAATASLSLGNALSQCSGGAAACYPPAVNYTPLYYLINGQAFDKTSGGNSLFAATAGVDGSGNPVTTGISGNVLVRLVNAGLRMHVPTVVGAQTGASNTAGFSLIAEDGNLLPGVPRVQSEVFMAAGKTYDVVLNVPAGGNALPIFDRQLSLSSMATSRDGGMLAYIGINGSGLPGAASLAGAQANPDTYNAVVPGNTLTVSDISKGVVANDINIFGVQVSVQPVAGSVTLSANGTFTYTPDSTWSSGTTLTTSDTFTYCGNGATTSNACATVTLGKGTIEASGGIAVPDSSYTANTSKFVAIKNPGVLAGAVDAAGYALTVDTSTIAVPSGSTLTVVADANGGFAATSPGPGVYTFSFQGKNSQGTHSSTATVTLTFPTANGPTVTVLDGADHTTQISDYRWVIEEDRTFYVDPNCTANPLPAGCPTVTDQGTPLVFSTNFHSSYMPVVATGCTGPLSCESGQTLSGSPAVCDVGDGACRTDGTQLTAVDPSQVVLDPSKRYYISVLPGDAANPFNAGYAGAPDCSTAGVAAGSCGHGMGGAPIAKGQTSVTVLTEPSPYPTAKLTVFVFEDDWPLNGEHDAGGGIDVLSPQEPGLGSFQITLFDDAGGTGDATGQPTFDMFNMPLTNSLAGTIDPATGLDACPISAQVTANTTKGDGSQKGVVGMIVTCPTYESDGVTLSPLAGQAVVNNLYQGRYGVVATPAADRIARGEEWLQTNTLDGQKAHDSFMRIGEPAYFQEFGPAGYHVTIGFANPKVINDRLPSICSGLTGTDSCTNEVKGHVTTARMSRPPDERLYGSGSRDSFAFTQCYASLGDPDGADFAFVKCDDQGNFDFNGIPSGNWKLTIFDQWNDQIVDGISTPVGLAGQSNSIADLKEVAVHQWQANIYTRTFIDANGNGVPDRDAQGNDLEPGLALVSTNIRFRDGSFSNFNNTDLNGYAGFNEIFPLFNWYTIETDSTRFKTTGVHVVYDAGGPTDGTCSSSTAPCGGSKIAQNYANTYEANPLPSDLSVPGAVYCDEGADCSTSAGLFALGSVKPSSTSNHSSGRIDPPFWFGSYGWQGYAGQNSFLEFGKKPFADGENGGIRGHVVYASTRPFDDPQLLLQLSWEPLVPHVRVNLYKEGVAADGVTSTLTLVDHTETSSFDDWSQGFRTDGKPNMNCPGQSDSDLYFFGLENQPNYLDWYNSQHGGPSPTPLPYKSQFKCYDGMHNWNQLQPAPYDGMYRFPSVTSLDPSNGRPTGTNCTVCTGNPDSNDLYRSGTPMLPAGKYVVEVVVPPGYELVKEEDKNILIGDNYIAPVTQQFGGLGNIFIMPDQAEVASAYNPNNAQNPTTGLGSAPRTEGDTGSVEQFWPCVGTAREVPDYISLFPGSAEVAPFAGATRNLCDRKEVTVENESTALAKFYLFTPTHVAAHYTGVITDDFTAEFDPFSPQFGEKFAPAYLPVSIKDWAGNEISRTYSDQWGSYNGLNYSTWEVNPPNPTGYGPTMMVTCMNDAGTGTTPDPLFQAGYSQFCYELPFMPGQTGYFDTPVVPTSAFSEGYNHPDCSYPDATPAIKEVDGDGVGPWVSAAGNALTITALGDQDVENYEYSGPSATAAPFNQQKVKRHYGFGATPGTVTIGGVALENVAWTDTTITGTVPSGVPDCAVQQQAMYGGSTAKCGQLLITAANGKQSVDTVTVTIGGKNPTRPTSGQSIQPLIDAAKPGDLIIVPPGTYNELLVMWKPVRLQGVGAASTIINANTHPAGKLDPWRQQVVCLFGLTADGRPSSGPYAGCPGANWTNFSGGPDFPQMVVDRVPMEGILGWDTSVNGNLAEQLIEPSLMGAYEGAAITVLGKGVKIPAGSTDPYGSGATESAFPDGTTLMTAADCDGTYPSNYYCNPASIDGLSLTNSSQGGGGIFVHAWAHNIQIANNRVHNNTGTMSGGITIGQGEHIDVPLAGDANVVPPGSCESSAVTNQGLPYCYNLNVNVHNNAVTLNSSIGDELFSSTPAGAGGVTFCNGADYYRFNYNWVCGNMSTGDGGGVAHLGFIKNGHIEHNTILFNQSSNPTITTNGGGLLIMGAPDPDPPCGEGNDKDCVPDPATITPSDGTGPGTVVNANLIMGNSADSGSGGGLRLQHVNGTDVINFPDGQNSCSTPATCLWNSVSITNNIITDNVAGWDGGGVSLQDALAVNIVNNTIVGNDSTASSGVLFGSLFAPLASAPGSNCTVNNGTQSCPQVAGVVSVLNSPVLAANLPASGLTCPPGNGTSGSCRNYSVPLLANNIIWQNRSFVISMGDFGADTQNQQKVVTLYNAAFDGSPAATPAASQSATGACPGGASYWDIGVRGDTGPANHGSGYSLAPTYSVLTDAADYPSANNMGADPSLLHQYCNGSRVPPENGGMGWQVPPGTNETNALPTPVFSLTPSATVDEGNNWINLRWGPLSMSDLSGSALGNYALSLSSPAIDVVPVGSTTLAPSTDFFGNQRPDPAVPTAYDIGAIETEVTPTLASISPNTGYQGWSVDVTLTGTYLGGTTGLNAGNGITATNVHVVNSTTVTATLNISTTAATGPRDISVVEGTVTTNAVTFTVTPPPPPTLSSISPIFGYRNSSLSVTLTGTFLTGGTVNLSGSGVTVSSVSYSADATQLTATLAISSTATLGDQSVTVSTAGGTTGAATFTVLGPPTLTSINPNTGARGLAVPVTLTGTNLNGVTSITVSGTGVTVSNLAVVSGTQVTATFTMTSNATISNRSVHVNTAGGSSNNVTFSVTTVPTPTLSSIAPNTGLRGTSVPVTLTGTNLTGASSVNVSGNGISVTSFTVDSATQISATFSISGSANLSGRNVTVTTGGGTSNSVTFTAVAPSLSSISPNSGLRGTSVAVTLTGSGLTGATSVSVSGNGVTVTSFTVNSATQISANFSISSSAAANGRNVTVATPGGTTNAVTFTVLGPTLTSISPTSGYQGTSVPVTLTGTNLSGATGLTNMNNGLSLAAGTFHVVNSTTVTATINISASAAATQRTIAVATSIGNTNTVAFTVQVPPAPTLGSISPSSASKPSSGTTNVPVTLTGTNFTNTGTSVAVSGTGVTIQNGSTVVVNSTTINVTLRVSSSANTGSRNVTVNTPGGGSGAVTFTVN